MNEYDARATVTSVIARFAFAPFLCIDRFLLKEVIQHFFQSSVRISTQSRHRNGGEASV
jgi:hypothetical protein